MNDKYFMLRYEDLTRNPIETLTRVFYLTGITMHMITFEWVESYLREQRGERIRHVNKSELQGTN